MVQLTLVASRMKLRVRPLSHRSLRDGTTEKQFPGSSCLATVAQSLRDEKAAKGHSSLGLGYAAPTYEQHQNGLAKQVADLFFVLVRGRQAQCLGIEFIGTLRIYDGNGGNDYPMKKEGFSTHRMPLEVRGSLRVRFSSM
jgi:hypothetical protein